MSSDSPALALSAVASARGPFLPTLPASHAATPSCLLGCGYLPRPAPPLFLSLPALPCSSWTSTVQPGPPWPQAGACSQLQLGRHRPTLASPGSLSVFHRGHSVHRPRLAPLASQHGGLCLARAQTSTPLAGQRLGHRAVDVPPCRVFLSPSLIPCLQVSLFNYVFLISWAFALPYAKLRRVASSVCTVWTCVIIVCKMLYQLQTIKPESFSVNCSLVSRGEGPTALQGSKAGVGGPAAARSFCPSRPCLSCPVCWASASLQLGPPLTLGLSLPTTPCPFGPS